MSIYKAAHQWTDADCGELSRRYQSLLSHHKQWHGAKRRGRRNWHKDKIWIWVNELNSYFDSAKE